MRLRHALFPADKQTRNALLQSLASLRETAAAGIVLVPAGAVRSARVLFAPPNASRPRPVAWTRVAIQTCF